MSIELLVILVPVIFGMMGFAFDLGRLYLVRGELNQAATAMAMAAAQQLIGTAASLDNATAAAQRTLDDAGGTANKYNFGSPGGGPEHRTAGQRGAGPAVLRDRCSRYRRRHRLERSGGRHNGAPYPGERHRRGAAAVLELSLARAVAQDHDCRARGGGYQRSGVHGVRHR